MPFVRHLLRANFSKFYQKFASVVVINHSAYKCVLHIYNPTMHRGLLNRFWKFPFVSGSIIFWVNCFLKFYSIGKKEGDHKTQLFKPQMLFCHQIKIPSRNKKVMKWSHCDSLEFSVYGSFKEMLYCGDWRQLSIGDLMAFKLWSVLKHQVS